MSIIFDLSAHQSRKTFFKQKQNVFLKKLKIYTLFQRLTIFSTAKTTFPN